MRAILADRDPIVRHALQGLMTQSLDMRVMGEAETATELQRLAATHRPELAIVSWDLVDEEPETALAALRTAAPGLRIVALAARPEIRRAALAAGADDFISKVDAPAEVLGILRRGHGAASAGDDDTARRPSGDRKMDRRGGQQ